MLKLSRKDLAMATMHAVWYEEFGPARKVLKQGDIETPSLGPGEVLIRVHVSGVNPSDVKRRSGRTTRAAKFPRVIPHQDGAGVIEAVGEGVPQSRVGERVWVYEAQIGRPFGTAAELVLVPSENAVRLPDGVDFERGATLGVPAMTAYMCLFLDGAVTGQTILISGGAGACGNYAIQMAKWGGANVIATVSSDAKAWVSKKAGADHVLNYREDDLVSSIMELTGGKGVDRVVEVAFGANISTDTVVLKQGGVIATYASDADTTPKIPFGDLITKCITTRFVLVYGMSRAMHKAAVDVIDKCLSAGSLHPQIAKKFTLAETVEAHEAVESRQCIGKVLVTI